MLKPLALFFLGSYSMAAGAQELVAQELEEDLESEEAAREEVEPEELPDAERDPLAPTFFGASVGLKGGPSGNYLMRPENVPRSTGILPFEDGAGGWGTGFGLYFEFRALEEHLGLEFDVIFGSTKTWSEITYNNVVETQWVYNVKTTRLPLLLEGSFGGRSTRISLGFGPEWVIGKSADFSVEVVDGEEYLASDVEALFSDSLLAIPQKNTHLLGNIGFGFQFWEMAVNLDFRYSYNMGQPADYLDRIEIDGASVSGVKASTNMDLHILLGLSYEFGFDLPK
jgi:hypothetical protein